MCYITLLLLVDCQHHQKQLHILHTHTSHLLCLTRVETENNSLTSGQSHNLEGFTDHPAACIDFDSAHSSADVPTSEAESHTVLNS